MSQWLDAPATMRLVGPGYDIAHDADNSMSGGSLAEWFDLIIRVGEVGPSRPLP